MQTPKPLQAGLRIVCFVCVALCSAPAAWAFPPYRSTDAGTADPGTLELRLGLVRLVRQEQDDSYRSPLLRRQCRVFAGPAG